MIKRNKLIFNLNWICTEMNCCTSGEIRYRIFLTLVYMWVHYFVIYIRIFLARLHGHFWWHVSKMALTFQWEGFYGMTMILSGIAFHNSNFSFVASSCRFLLLITQSTREVGIFVTASRSRTRRIQPCQSRGWSESWWGHKASVSLWRRGWPLCWSP